MIQSVFDGLANLQGVLIILTSLEPLHLNPHGGQALDIFFV